MRAFMTLWCHRVGVWLLMTAIPSGVAFAQQDSASSPSCRPMSTDSTLRLVQSSRAFRFAVHSLEKAESHFGGGIEDAQIQRLCAAMVSESLSVLPGVTLVHAPALFGIDRSFTIFAVRDGRVMLLNPRPDGNFRFGLHVEDWNSFLAEVQLSPRIPDAREVQAYACLLLKYLKNYMSGNPCAGRLLSEVRRLGDSWHVEFFEYRWQVDIRDDGRIERQEWKEAPSSRRAPPETYRLTALPPYRLTASTDNAPACTAPRPAPRYTRPGTVTAG